jgi:hypothetical protein
MNNQRHWQHWVLKTQAIKNEQSETLTTLGTQDTGAIKNEQSETLTTLGTQDTGRRKAKQKTQHNTEN